MARWDPGWGSKQRRGSGGRLLKLAARVIVTSHREDQRRERARLAAETEPERIARLVRKEREQTDAARTFMFVALAAVVGALGLLVKTLIQR